MVFSVIRRQERNDSAPFEKKKTGGKIGGERGSESSAQGGWERMTGRRAGTGAGSGGISSFRLADNQRQ